MRTRLVRTARLSAGLALVAGAGLTLPVTSSTAATSGTAQSYLVLYRGSTSPADAAGRIVAAGGQVVADYSQIGVLVARSSATTFATSVAKDVAVEGVSATAGFATRLHDDAAGQDTSSTAAPANAPVAGDSLSPLQWDMRQIHAPQAQAITAGSPAVIVGDIDTGTDYRHPDLRANIDDARSANCVSGAPVQGAVAANDDNGHGTHTAGTIAAAANGFGIVGVAPSVRIASIKAGNADGFFFPESVICSFMWAGSQHLDVTNNSYFADPYLYNCKNDPVQRAIWKAEQRAIRFAMTQGVTVVAAEGNESDDLAHPTQDVTSPDDTTPVTRAIHNDCIVIPTEIPGVIGVTASGNATQDGTAGAYADHLKSFYSSYGMASADVVAPGGDSLFGKTAEAPNGRVLSTWPADKPCRRPVVESTTDASYPQAVYCYLQGTSMASPHVAGIAALVVSRYGTPHLAPGRVAAVIGQTADPQMCPATTPTGYADFLSVSNGAPQVCTGGAGHTSWYGSGEADALGAVGGPTG